MDSALPFGNSCGVIFLPMLALNGCSLAAQCRKKPSRHVSFSRLGLRLYRNLGLYRSSRDAQILGSVWALFLLCLYRRWWPGVPFVPVLFGFLIFVGAWCMIVRLDPSLRTR